MPDWENLRDPRGDSFSLRRCTEAHSSAEKPQMHVAVSTRWKEEPGAPTHGRAPRLRGGRGEYLQDRNTLSCCVT